MFTVLRTDEEIMVQGPEGFSAKVDSEAYGVVLRKSLLDPEADEPMKYVVPVAEMTDCEIIATALELFAYPQS